MLRKTRDEMRQRAGGRCEFPGCSRHGTDLAHGFRRGNVIGQPLCDHPSLCWWACREHHDFYDGRSWAIENAAVIDLQWRLASWAIEAFGYDPTLAGQDLDCAIDLVRWLERRLRDTGVIRGREWAT